MIKIDFEFDTRHGVYRDAITLADDHQFTAQQIEDMKQARVDAWLAHIDNPPPPPEEPETIEIDGVTYQRV